MCRRKNPVFLIEMDMSNVVHLSFLKANSKRSFSADIYSDDMKKFQLEGSASSIWTAYELFIYEAEEKLGIDFIRCVAIYEGGIDSRSSDSPIKVWQQDVCMPGLKEI